MRLKEQAREQGIKQMIRLLSNISDENLIRLTYLAEKIDIRKNYTPAILAVRKAFENKEPSYFLAKNILKLIENIKIKKSFFYLGI